MDSPKYDQLKKTVTSSYFAGRNYMRISVVSKELEIGDRLYSDNSIIMTLDKKIGKQYKLVIIDTKQGNDAANHIQVISW